MKKLFIIIIIFISFQQWTKADDIKDFEIEGFFLGESLLTFFAKEKIDQEINSKWALKYNNEFIQVGIGYSSAFPLSKKLKNYNEVTRLQNLHSWSSVYWYKNGNSHFRHIDHFGELACFVNFTKKGEDYQSGGLQIEIGENTISLDDSYDYGDLLFLDQSMVFHEVLPIKALEQQVGRIQLYIPTIPPNYMKKTLVFEGHENEAFFTNENITLDKKRILFNQVSSEEIHYSRKIYKHYRLNL